MDLVSHRRLDAIEEIFSPDVALLILEFAIECKRFTISTPPKHDDVNAMTTIAFRGPGCRDIHDKYRWCWSFVLQVRTNHSLWIRKYIITKSFNIVKKCEIVVRGNAPVYPESCIRVVRNARCEYCSNVVPSCLRLYNPTKWSETHILTFCKECFRDGTSFDKANGRMVSGLINMSNTGTSVGQKRTAPEPCHMMITRSKKRRV